MDSTNANVSVPNSNMTFTSLPPEIRNMIYSLLLVKNEPITIASPRHRRSRVNAEFTSDNFARLLRVSKQIHNEASSVFYSVNTFVVGNGDWGSKNKPNLHALRAFTARVPSRFLACITEIHYTIHLRWCAASGTSLGHFILGTSADASDLHSISRALSKHFTGLKVIDVYFTTDGPYFEQLLKFQSEKLSDKCAHQEICRMIHTLSKLKSLTDVSIISPDFSFYRLYSSSWWSDFEKIIGGLWPNPQGKVTLI